MIPNDVQDIVDQLTRMFKHTLENNLYILNSVQGQVSSKRVFELQSSFRLPNVVDIDKQLTTAVENRIQQMFQDEGHIVEDVHVFCVTYTLDDVEIASRVVGYHVVQLIHFDVSYLPKISGE